MSTLGQFVALLLLIGVVGAYFWPIALTLTAAYLSSIPGFRPRLDWSTSISMSMLTTIVPGL